MATSKAQNAPANGPGNANGKTNGNIKVIMPDANGDFTAPIAKGAVEKVQVVDVDMVLQLKDGTSLVLAGGAISAMDASHTGVTFSDGVQGLSNLFDLVGTIAIPKLDPILSSLQGAPNSEGQGSGANNPVESAGLTASVTTQIVNQLTQIVQVNSQSVTIQTVDPTAQTAVLSQNTKTGDVDSQPLQHTEPPIPPERPGVIPQEHIVGPDVPAMALSLVNLTTITQIGNVLYGSGGTPASATDASNPAQFASQVINAPANATEIHAISNIPPNDFIKVVDMALTGNGIAQSITVKGVPAGMSIANGTDMGGGVWSVPVVAGQRDYGIQIEYTTTLANPQAPIHQQFSLEFDVSMTTADGIVELSQVKLFVIKDVTSANDLTYIDSTTGQSVYVLPAQGNSHIIHAGDAGVEIFGSNAADFLYGGAGVDTIHGGSGNTYFEGGGGADQLLGGATGINTAGYTQSAAGVTVDLIAGTGTGGDAQGDTLTNIQNVIGSAHNDVVVSGTGANNINGGGHDAGGDTVSYAGSTAGVTVNLITGAGLGGNAQGDVLTNIQNVIGSAHNDTFIASSDSNTFTGGGRDVTGVGDIVSYAFDTSGLGATVDLSQGTRSAGAAAGDKFINIDGITGTAFNDTFIDGAGANRYDGGAGGSDTVSYIDSTAGVQVNLSNGHGAGGFAAGDLLVNIQNIIGSTHDDVFTAGSDSKSFTGGGTDAGGVDTVSFANSGAAVRIDNSNPLGDTGTDGNGGSFVFSGIQKFVGSAFNDTFISGLSANVYAGGGGSDTVDYSLSTGAVTVDLTFTTGQGTSGGYAAGDVLVGVSNIIGSNFDDTFLASADVNAFEGGGGSNTVSYFWSQSGVIVDLSNTTLPGTSGGFALGDSFSHIQNLIGSSFDDTFVASNDANRFDGGTGGTSNGGVNTVSYSQAGSGVVVDLSNTTGLGTSGGAAGDSFIRIQNLIGSAYDDTFVASSDANVFDGGSAGSDTVSYASSGAAVTVDLSNTTGAGTSGGFADGDRFISIENVTGSTFNDTFFASLSANSFKGGGGVDTVDYSRAPADGNGIVVDLVNGVGTGGYAAGDSYLGIQNVTGTVNNDRFIANNTANALVGGGGIDTVDYSTVGGGAVTIDLSLTAGTGTGGLAQGDTYVGIRNVIGGEFDDTFTANTDVSAATSNSFDGGASTAASHNKVSYAGTGTGVTVNLSGATVLGVAAGAGSGGAIGDKYVNIQDVTGTLLDDTIVASSAANTIDGGTGSLHNRVDYSASVDGVGVAVGVTVDLNQINGGGTSGGYAQGDVLKNIQDVTGSGADDTIVASLAANNLDGKAGSDTVSYVNTLNTVGVTVDLFTGLGSGAGSYAEGDIYTNIENVIGTQFNDTFYATLDANRFTGGGGVDTVNYSHAPNDGNGVTVNLITGAGSGGYAAGDTYFGIQNAVGTVNNDTFIGNNLANAFTGFGGIDTVDYSAVGGGAVTVDFSTTTGTGTGGLAQGDTYVGIRNVIGGEFDDTFVANTDVNIATFNSFDGGTSTVASHNRVSYAGTGTGVTVNLSAVIVGGVAAGTGGGGAIGDKYANIQDVTGTLLDDTIVASSAANTINGGLGTLHNRVDYSASVDAGNVAAGVVVDLTKTDGTGTSGGYAQGDVLSNIQDITGSGAADTFYASAANNNFDGGAGSDTVSYERTTDANGVTVDLFFTDGTGTSGGLAAGDTFIRIENVIGTANNDTFIDGSGAVSNTYTGLGGSNTVDYNHSNAGVTVNLFTGLGAGGFAAGDVYNGIQNVKGSAFNDFFVDGSGAAADAYVGNGGVDRIDYSNSGAAVQVNFGSGLSTGAIGTGTGGFAALDTYRGIQNVTGSQFDDTFTASTDTTAATANAFDGGVSTAASHNQVSYFGTGTGVTVNLSAVIVGGVAAGTGSGGAAGDTYANIQDVTGTLLDDTIVASSAANTINGGLGTLHNRVDYSASVDAGNVAAGVVVDLTKTDGTGTSGGYAQGDVLSNIQDITGSGAADTFYASAANNNFDGGAGSDTVSYERTTDANGVTVDLFFTDGTGTTGGLAAGDTFIRIENVIGTANNDTFIDGSGAVSNTYTGLGGSNTVDYNHSNAGVTVDLSTGQGTGGFAQGDIYVGIQNVKGSAFADFFVDGSGAAPDAYTGNGGVDRIDYSHSNAGVQVNFGTGLLTGAGATGTGTGGFAAGDTYLGVQNILGSQFDDTFTASTDTTAATANSFDGGASTAASHNRVSYAGTGTGVTVNLSTVTVGGVAAGTGAAGAIGDHYANIQDVTGTASDDTIVASAAANFIDGGTSTAASHNRVDYSASVDGVGAAAGVIVDLTQTNGNGTSGGYAAGDTLINIQDVTGSGAADTFVASAAANRLDGGAGSDTVDYSGSTAIIVNLSGATANGLNAGTGSGGLAAGDTYISIENVKGGAGNDLFYAGTTANVFTGGGGIDTVSYVNSAAGVTASLLVGVAGTGGDAAGDTFLGITNLTGTAQVDTLTGLLAGGSTLDGGANNDTLIATGGNNTLIGGTGNDNLTAGGDNNLFIGGANADTMTGTGGLNNTADYTGSGAVVVDLFFTNGTGTSGGDATGDVLSGIQNVKGSANADTFVGNSVANVFTGNGGIDTVSYFHSTASVIASLLAGVGGTAGDAAGDTYNAITNLTGGTAADTLTGLLVGGSTLTGNDGNDILIATGGNNTLIGGNDNDTMTASGGNNQLLGGSGDDTMTGNGGNNTFTGGTGADTMTGTGTGNRAVYTGSTAVIIDLVNTDGTGTSGGDATGDKLSGIQNITGSAGNDVFILNEVANDVVAGGGVDTVSYLHEVVGTDITIDLSGTAVGGVIGATGTGAFGAADVFHGIQNATGGGGHDIFIASGLANAFDGGSGTETDTVSYAANTGIADNTAGVTIDFTTVIGTGTGNWANGDTYSHIENVIGTSANDKFIDGGGVVNSYDGGNNGATSHDLVSYQFVATGGALTIGLDGAMTPSHNTGNAATGNVGDTYSHISDLTGSATLDTTIWGDTNANILTALGTTNTNILNGGGGNDTLDARLGGHNTVLAGTSGTTIIESTVSLGGDGITSVVGSNVVSINGSTSNTTLDLHNLSSFLDLSTFRGVVSNITMLDLKDMTDTDKGSGAAGGTQAKISSDDIVALGVNTHGYSELTVALDTNIDSLRLDTPAGQYQVITTSATTNDFAYYSLADNHEIAVLHVLK